MISFLFSSVLWGNPWPALSNRVQTKLRSRQKEHALIIAIEDYLMVDDVQGAVKNL